MENTGEDEDILELHTIASTGKTQVNSEVGKIPGVIILQPGKYQL